MVDSGVAWRTHPERQTLRDRERTRRRRKGEGHPTHVSRKEVVEDIRTLESPFRSFSSSC